MGNMMALLTFTKSTSMDYLIDKACHVLASFLLSRLTCYTSDLIGYTQIGHPLIVMHGGMCFDKFQATKVLTIMYSGYLTIQDILKNISPNSWQNLQLLTRSVRPFLKMMLNVI
jgi:hypothetical protein